MEYSFHFYNSMAETGILLALRELAQENTAAPVVLAIGSDLAIGDSFGPITGTMLRGKAYGGFLYGTLKQPVTANEVKYLNNFIRRTHPVSPIIAVDAAVGEESDIGLIKVMRGGLCPGAGAKKRLGRVGDISILGIVAGRSGFSFGALQLTRLNMVYRMAEAAAGALAAFALERRTQLKRVQGGV